jgi:hypothetical protein
MSGTHFIHRVEERTFPPKTPRSTHEEDLGFVRKEMVGWFNPGQLLDSAVRTALSIIFSAYSDKREVQAALEKPRVYDDYANESEIWIDYIADLGDGWNSTYTMAKLLAAKELSFTHENQHWKTPRGRILIMGGDEVYPTAKRREYRDRLIGPYQSALPWVPKAETPQLFAIPGNHDWYDGLTNFLRTFCQEKWIGAWKTQQTRSYFAIKLPHHWWLWGIDIQLESRIDKPQLDYFKSIAENELHQGDRIVLCTAEPSWVYAAIKGPEAYKNLEYFERTIIYHHGGIPVLTLAGDLHHYSRYTEKDGARQRITAGGGGAYLSGTHQMPKELKLKEQERQAEYNLEKIFPDKITSIMLSAGVLLHPFTRWRFSLFLGGFYSLFAWIAQGSTATNGSTFMDRIAKYPPAFNKFGIVLEEFWRAISHNALGLLFVIALIWGAIAFCDATRKYVKYSVGTIHGLLHLALFLWLAWLAAYLNYSVLQLPRGHLPDVLLVIVEMVIFGGFLGSLLVSGYLLLSNLLLNIHIEHVFASQGIEHYKNFLRLHIDHHGDMTIYPIGIKKICTKWDLNPRVQNGGSWFEPSKECTIHAHLIEKPIPITNAKNRQMALSQSANINENEHWRR